MKKCGTLAWQLASKKEQEERKQICRTYFHKIDEEKQEEIRNFGVSGAADG